MKKNAIFAGNAVPILDLSIHWMDQAVYVFNIGTSLKGKNLLPEGANSFLRAVPYGMENHFYHIR